MRESFAFLPRLCGFGLRILRIKTVAEILLKRIGDMLCPVDEAGKAFVRGLEGVAKIKIVRPRETRLDILNRLSHAIYNEAAKQIDGTEADDEKAFCKYTYGIPILIHDPEDGAECADYYRRLFDGVDYEQRIARMYESHRFYVPVTSLMTDEQLIRYVKRCVRHYAEDHGVPILTPREKQWLNDPEFQRGAN